MKRIILTIWVLLLVLFSCNSQDYITTKEGNRPIMITSSHGGQIRLLDEQRDCDNCLYQSDLHTDVIAKYIARALDAYLVVNNLHRSTLDANRDSRTAYAGEISKNNYLAYHGFIENTARMYSTYEDLFLIIDVHGQAHDHGKIELGYDIPKYILNDRERLEDFDDSVFKNIDYYSLADLVYGYRSLGTLFEIFGYSTYPSSVNSYITGEYFNGGFTTEKYKEYENVIVIQLELPYKGIREHPNKLGEFANITARIIEFYYKQLNKE